MQIAERVELCSGQLHLHTSLYKFYIIHQNTTPIKSVNISPQGVTLRATNEHLSRYTYNLPIIQSMHEMEHEDLR